MRGWMRDIPSYLPPVEVGAEMRGSTVNEVLASKDPAFGVGDIVSDNSMVCLRAADECNATVVL